VQIASPSDVSAERVKEFTSDGGFHRVSPFIGSYEGGDSDFPEGYLVEFRPRPGGRIEPHFHKVAQYQVIVGGDGHLGKHAVSPISFHFADLSTPYGPITPTGAAGIEFFTLRPARRPGTWHMPGSKHEMLGRAGRNVSVGVEAQPLPERGVSSEVLLDPHADGLASFRLRLGPGEEATGPAPAGSGGQYYVVIAGALQHDGQDLPPRSLLFIGPDEAAPTIAAGSEGADVLVLQFPVKTVL
jgi:hypothetical protein